MSYCPLSVNVLCCAAKNLNSLDCFCLLRFSVLQCVSARLNIVRAQVFGWGLNSGFELGYTVNCYIRL